MGKKDTAVFAAIVLLLANPSTVRASTVEDLYNVYGIEKDQFMDSEALNIVERYNDVKRFIAMYNYIDLSVPDTTSQDEQVSALERRISQIDTELFNGFDLTISEILDLESEQNSARESIDRINKTREYSMVYIDIPEADNIPSYSEYLDALNRIESVNTLNIIGDMTNMKLPADNGTISAHDDVLTVIKCNSPTVVRSVFSGTVIGITDKSAIVVTDGGVIIVYDNLSIVTVSNGDAIDQNQQIGYTLSNFSMSMRILDKYYDMWRLYN